MDRIHASLTPQNSDILTLLSASKCHSLDYVTIDGVSKGDTIPPSVVWKMTKRVSLGWTTDDERATQHLFRFGDRPPSPAVGQILHHQTLRRHHPITMALSMFRVGQVKKLVHHKYQEVGLSLILYHHYLWVASMDRGVFLTESTRMSH